MKMKPVHPWHDIKIGDKAPEIVNTIIEIPKDSHIKYEMDKETGMLKLDRFLYSAAHYPGDYGFVPQTVWEDGDALDILVITHRPGQSMMLAEVKVIGVLRMIDNGEKDDKIIGVYSKDPRYNQFNDIKDVPAHMLKEIVHFFETYKQLEGKDCKILKILPKKEALLDVKLASKMYKDKYSNTKND